MRSWARFITVVVLCVFGAMRGRGRGVLQRLGGAADEPESERFAAPPADAGLRRGGIRRRVDEPTQPSSVGAPQGGVRKRLSKADGVPREPECKKPLNDFLTQEWAKGELQANKDLKIGVADTMLYRGFCKKNEPLF